MEKEKKDETLAGQIAKGGSVTFIGKVVGKAAKFGFQILISRSLGATPYGLYALGYSILNMLSIPASLGLKTGVVKFGSSFKAEGSHGSLKGTIILSVGISFLVSIVVSLATFLSARWISVEVFSDPALTEILKIFSFALPFYVPMTVACFSARIFRKMGYDIGVRRVLNPIALVIFSAVALSMGFEIKTVIYVFTSVTIVSLGLIVLLLVKEYPDIISLSNVRLPVKNLMQYSIRVLLVGLSSILIFKIDRIMISIFSTTKNVGIYSAAAIMAGQLTIFLGSINAIFSPIISGLYTNGNIQRLEKMFKTSTKWAVALTLPTAAILFTHSDAIMKLYGPEFIAGSSTLSVICVAHVVNVGVGPSSFMLTMTDYENIALVNNIAAGILNVVLNYIFIPWYGVLGAAVATGFSIAFVNILRLLQVCFFIGVIPYRYSTLRVFVIWLLLSTVLMLTNLYYNTSLFKVVASILVYISFYASLVYLFCLGKDDREIINKVKRHGYAMG